jgi:hypothetical protein
LHRIVAPIRYAGLDALSAAWCCVQAHYDRGVGRSIVCAVVVVLALAGCREERPQTPAACLESRAVPKALARAPGEVRFADGTKLSDCLVKTSETADLQQFAITVLDEATRLRESARDKPGGPALVELGYLKGALERGADLGIHDELLRRLDQELLDVDRRAPAFKRGEAAGLAGG